MPTLRTTFTCTFDLPMVPGARSSTFLQVAPVCLKNASKLLGRGKPQYARTFGPPTSTGATSTDENGASFKKKDIEKSSVRLSRPSSMEENHPSHSGAFTHPPWPPSAFASRYNAAGRCRSMFVVPFNFPLAVILPSYWTDSTQR